MIEFAAILPAAGNSLRFGGDKLRHHLGGIPVISRSIRAFAQRDDVSLVMIPLRPQVAEDPDEHDRVRASHPTKVQTCAGGESRAHSVMNALREIPATIDWIAIHDAARPLVSDQLISSVLSAAIKY